MSGGEGGSMDDDHYEDYDDSFDTLHDIVDATRKRETEDSDFPLADLFKINIGAGRRVVLTEKDDSQGLTVHLIGFSHR